MRTQKEQFYIEDFQCYRHYVIAVVEDIDNKKANLLLQRPTNGENLFFIDRSSYRYFYRVVIFDNIDNIDLTKLTLERGTFNDLINFSNNRMKNKPYSFYFMKINRNWILSNISEEKNLIFDGKDISYRTATIDIRKDKRFF